MRRRGFDPRRFFSCSSPDERGTKRPERFAAVGETSDATPVHPRMNSTRHSCAALSAAILVAAGFIGCARRPIIVQAPPATVIQSPVAPTMAAVSPPVVVLKEAPPSPKIEEVTPKPSSEYVW